MSLIKKSIIALAILLISGSAFANPNLSMDSCNDSGLCTVFQVAVKIKDSGSRGSHSNSDVIYIGGTSNPYTATVEWEKDTCSKEVRVPVNVFKSIVSVMESISGETEDGLPPVLTPAQQTILLFYSTLMQQTLSFTCPQAM